MIYQVFVIDASISTFSDAVFIIRHFQRFEQTLDHSHSVIEGHVVIFRLAHR